MSEVRVNNIVDYGGKGAPTFDNGAVISGVSSLGNQAKIGSNVTITSGGINVSGVTTAATLSGNLTGDVSAGFLTATSTVIGSGVTINAGGLNITGVCTATTFEGSGASMTGVAMTITPLAYNPDVSDTTVSATGIGITFDHRILAGSGNVTLSIATNAGAAGTTVENFGVGSSVTIAGRKAIITPSSSLNNGETYHISYPSGAFTNTGGDVSYVGTAYTFGIGLQQAYEFWIWGQNDGGQLGQNNVTYYSSPVQIPGTTWVKGSGSSGRANDSAVIGIRQKGQLFVWGKYNTNGTLGLNNTTRYSSPVQLPGSWFGAKSRSQTTMGVKTDGTLWTWGSQNSGQLGDNSVVAKSSPVQVPGATWAKDLRKFDVGNSDMAAIKTDGTLWGWGDGGGGKLANGGNASSYSRSSPVQVPGTTWRSVVCGQDARMATKTDGTLWTWGNNMDGASMQNNNPDSGTVRYLSPVQVGSGTDWSEKIIMGVASGAIKTDGTLWVAGPNTTGVLGQNDRTSRSSPIQIPGTTWSEILIQSGSAAALKTDGTIWAWGGNDNGELGQNNTTKYSSPVQVGSLTTWTKIGNADARGFQAFKSS